MRRLLQLGLLIAALAWCVPAQATISRTGFCSASTTSCTLSGTATGDLIVTFAFRSGSTTAPSLPGSNTSITTVSTTSGGTVGSYRVACRRASSGSDTGTGTYTNATSVASISFSGTPVIATGSCNVAGMGIGNNGCGTPTNCWAKTSTTTTYKTISLKDGNTNSWVVGFMGGSASSTCTPASLTNVSNTGTIRASDSNGTAASFADDTCSVSSETWMSYTVEIMAGCNAGGRSMGHDWSCVQYNIPAQGGSGSSSAVTATLPANASTSNEVRVVAVWCGSAGTCADTSAQTVSLSGTAIDEANCVADPMGNPQATSNRYFSGWVCPGTAGTTCIGTPSGSVSFLGMFCFEFSGGQLAFDGNGGVASGTGTASTDTLTVGSTTDLMFCAQTTSGAVTALAAKSGFSFLGAGSASGAPIAEGGTGLSGSTSGGFTWTTSVTWGTYCGITQAASGGGGGPNHNNLPLMGVGD